MKFEEPIAEIKDRLQIALNYRNMKPVELSEKTGIPKSSISHYLSGSVEPKQNRIYKMAQVLCVSESWLMGFDVSMEKSETEAMLYELAQKKIAHEELISLFDSMNEEGQEVALNVLRGLATQYKKSNQSNVVEEA